MNIIIQLKYTPLLNVMLQKVRYVTAWGASKSSCTRSDISQLNHEIYLLPSDAILIQYYQIHHTLKMSPLNQTGQPKTYKLLTNKDIRAEKETVCHCFRT